MVAEMLKHYLNEPAKPTRANRYCFDRSLNLPAMSNLNSIPIVSNTVYYVYSSTM